MPPSGTRRGVISVAKRGSAKRKTSEMNIFMKHAPRSQVGSNTPPSEMRGSDRKNLIQCHAPAGNGRFRVSRVADVKRDGRIWSGNFVRMNAFRQSINVPNYQSSGFEIIGAFRRALKISRLSVVVFASDFDGKRRRSLDESNQILLKLAGVERYIR